MLLLKDLQSTTDYQEGKRLVRARKTQEVSAVSGGDDLRSKCNHFVKTLLEDTSRDSTIFTMLLYHMRRYEISQSSNAQQVLPTANEATMVLPPGLNASAVSEQLRSTRGFKSIIAFGSGITVLLFFLLVIGIPIFAVFVVYGCVYPLARMFTAFSNQNPVELLAVTLTVIYMALLVCLFLLCPFVWRYHTFRSDIVSLNGFPQDFYSVVVVKELHRRFVTHIDLVMIERALDYAFGIDIARYILEFVGGDINEERRRL